MLLKFVCVCIHNVNWDIVSFCDVFVFVLEFSIQMALNSNPRLAEPYPLAVIYVYGALVSMMASGAQICYLPL